MKNNKVNKFSSLLEFTEVFNKEQDCLDYLKKIRWSEGEYCPYCGCSKIYTFKDKKNYKCADCRKRFSIKVGTIFEDTKVPLRKWFLAIYLLTAHKKGISSLQLSRDLQVTQKTAWFILHRLRHATNTEAFKSPLKNIVEVDETYIGGKYKNKHMSKRKVGSQGRSLVDKTPVLGMLERKGKVIAIKLKDTKNQTITSQVVKNVIIGTKIVTDEYRAYKTLGFIFKHSFICHNLGQYVMDESHTNTIENYWSHLKRMIIGIYHYTSEKHIQKYIDECTFRYNTRDYTEAERFDKFLLQINGRLSYNVLTA